MFINWSDYNLIFFYLEKLWVPDTFFANEKSNGARHDITTPNILIKLHSNGRILISQR